MNYSIRKATTKVEIVTANIIEYMKKMPEQSINKYSLSDATSCNVGVRLPSTHWLQLKSREQWLHSKLSHIQLCLVGRGDTEIAQALFVRYSVQRAIERVVETSAELLGGMAFIRSEEIAYLLSASRALEFHPPSRLSMAPYLDAYLAGESLVMP